MSGFYLEQNYKIMIAKISFNIFDDYYQYTNDDKDNHYGYQNALDVLNKQLEKWTKTKKLTFVYKGKRVPIILPLTLDLVGNIFSPFEYNGPQWNKVDIPCEIDIDPKDFDSSKLKTNVYPDHFHPWCVCW